MGAMEATLAALREASTMAGRVPIISPVAGLLLQVFTMRDASVPPSPQCRFLPVCLQEVKQYKEEWDLVMHKLERIASLVDKVRVLCEKHNMETTDVPRSLLVIFESLVTYVVVS